MLSTPRSMQAGLRTQQQQGSRVRKHRQAAEGKADAELQVAQLQCSKRPPCLCPCAACKQALSALRAQQQQEKDASRPKGQQQDGEAGGDLLVALLRLAALLRHMPVLEGGGDEAEVVAASLEVGQ